MLVMGRDCKPRDAGSIPATVSSGPASKYRYHLACSFARWRRYRNTSVATAMQVFRRLANTQNSGAIWHNIYWLAH